MAETAGSLRNVRLTLCYDGSDFAGWQVQPGQRTVQMVVESAIERLTGEGAIVRAAGRTDAGVHALGQVANFTTSSRIPCNKLRSGLQRFLPDDVVVTDVSEVAADFHSTYSATGKRYRYVIHNTRIAVPWLRRYVYQYNIPLDPDAMHAAGQVLVGTHDFRSFESHFPNKATSVRTVRELFIRREQGWTAWAGGPGAELDNSFICMDIVADGFLYNMVRSIVGTLISVGRGRWSAADVESILTSQDRSAAGDTAPASGLYLVSVDYPEDECSEARP